MTDEEYETQIRANDIYIMDKMQEEITQLTNNWNELEEWLKEWLEEKSEDEFDYAIDDTIRFVLDKMKEIKGDVKDK